jgi:cytochrome c556
MQFPHIAAAAAILATAMTSTAIAQDFDNQLAARQGQFRVMALNLGVLGGMARGNIEHDAEAAQAAADNIAAIAMLDQRFAWPEGSDAMSIDGTRAEPTIWDDMADFQAKWADFGEAATALQAAAADPEALGAAVGALGNTCKSCHEAHRTPEE